MLTFKMVTQALLCLELPAFAHGAVVARVLGLLPIWFTLSSSFVFHCRGVGGMLDGIC